MAIVVRVLCLWCFLGIFFCYDSALLALRIKFIFCCNLVNLIRVFFQFSASSFVEIVRKLSLHCFVFNKNFLFDFDPSL